MKTRKNRTTEGLIALDGKSTTCHTIWNTEDVVPEVISVKPEELRHFTRVEVAKTH